MSIICEEYRIYKNKLKQYKYNLDNSELSKKEIDNINRILTTANNYIEKCDYDMCNLIFNVKLKHLDY